MSQPQQCVAGGGITQCGNNIWQFLQYFINCKKTAKWSFTSHQSFAMKRT